MENKTKLHLTKAFGGWLSALICTLILAGCSSTPTTIPDTNQYPTPPADNGLAATVKASPNKLVLGISTPGQQQEDWNAVGGAPISAEVFNRAGGVTSGGVNYYITLSVHEDNSRPDGVAAAATQIINDEDATGLIGPESVEGLAPNLRLFSDLTTPTLLTLTSDTLLDKTRQNPYLFYLRPLDRNTATTVVNYLAANQLLKQGVKVALVNQQNDAGQAGANQIKSLLAAKLNLKPSLEAQIAELDNKIKPEHNQYAAQVQKLVEASPDLVISWSNTEESAELLFELHQKGWHGQYVTSALTAQFASELNTEAENVLGPVTWLPDSTDPESQKLVQLYQAYFHRNPDDRAAAVYDAIRLFAEANKQVGPDKTKVRDWLAHLNGWHGLQGSYTTQPDGEMITTVKMAQVKSGKITAASEPTK